MIEDAIYNLENQLLDYADITLEYPNIIVTKHSISHNDNSYPLTEAGIDKFIKENSEFVEKLEFFTNFDRFDLFSLIEV